jgi:hypothetical protein
MVMRLLCAALTFPWRGPLLGSEDECGKANNMPSQKSPKITNIPSFRYFRNHSIQPQIPKDVELQPMDHLNFKP